MILSHYCHRNFFLTAKSTREVVIIGCSISKILQSHQIIRLLSFVQIMTNDYDMSISWNLKQRVYNLKSKIITVSYPVFAEKRKKINFISVG